MIRRLVCVAIHRVQTGWHGKSLFPQGEVAPEREFSWGVYRAMRNTSNLNIRFCEIAAMAIALISQFVFAMDGNLKQTPHAYHLIVSVRDQQMALLENGKQVRSYKVSTAKNGVGEVFDSDLTPRGRHEIAEKIGDGAPIGMVFVALIPTGEIVKVNQPGRWPIVTRVFRLRGLEEKNINSFDRMIYLHGSPVERLLGSPASGGCIRMRSGEIVELFDLIDVGTPIDIIEESLPVVLAGSRY